MRLTSGSGLALATRALLFTLLFNLPYIATFLVDGCYHHALVSDVDELCYLPRTIDIGAGVSPSRFFIEHTAEVSRLQVALNEPYSLPEVVFGSLAAVLHIPAFCLGLLLDVILVWATYVITARCFRLLSPSSLAAEIGVLMYIAFPLLFPLDQWVQTDLSWTGFLVAADVGATSGLPAVRGLSTQTSYIFYSLFLLSLVRAFLGDSPRGKLRSFALAGLWSGVLIHVYFFAWVTSFVLAGLAMLGVLLFRSRALGTGFGEMVKGGFAFGIAHLLVATPGVLVMMFGSGFHSVTKFPELRAYWYFTIEVFGVLIATTWLLVKTRRSDDRRLRVILTLLWTLPLAQLLLMNLQPILATFLTPFRFVHLYLHPLFTGLLTTLLVSRIVRLRRKSRLLGLAIVLLFPFIRPVNVERLKQSSKTLFATFRPEGTKDELQRLIDLLRETLKPNDVLAVMSAHEVYRDIPGGYIWRALPNVLNAFTGNPLLHQHWVLPVDISGRETLERELVLTWLFTGRPHLLVPCVDRPVELP
ncbi:MAG: hypothetical protein IT290_10015, partial [Deltaproteobacteria bacterium]|nr:hypothetical protein [Deltaproteobacteria bacterium]